MAVERSSSRTRLPKTGKEPDLARLDYEVLIVGTGIAGIGMAIELMKQGIDSFALLERADDVGGGTWRDNRYPGVAIDITTFAYSYSFEQRPDWSRVFAPGSELQAYVGSVATKYAVCPKVRFGVEVDRASFDEDRHLWRVHLSNGEQLVCRYLIGATGGLITPKMPDIPGRRQADPHGAMGRQPRSHRETGGGDRHRGHRCAARAVHRAAAGAARRLPADANLAAQEARHRDSAVAQNDVPAPAAGPARGACGP